MKVTLKRSWFRGALLLVIGALTGCSSGGMLQQATYQSQSPDYVIGPGDNIKVFVWGNNELSASVPVRPDGKITTPLVEDVVASGKTPSELARDMEKHLAKYIRNPVATVIVTGFVGRYNDQVRVIGEAATPQSLPYKESMTLLDIMIEVGGLTDTASGNSARLFRRIQGKQKEYGLRIDDLLNGGDITANVDILPGDVVIIPESWF